MAAAPPTSRSIGFEQLAEIATGSTASVALCRAIGPELDGKLLAVKRLHPGIADDSAVATRFLDEVWMTASLQHPNVVGVVGWGTDGKGDYLACELVQGVSLARLMKTVFDTGEEFPERMVVYIGLCLCRGLSAAHTLRSTDGALLQLVHRDLCAENVLVGFNGDVKIADFGLAKAKQRLTQTTMGLPQRSAEHMAPEEAKGAEIDHRADLFALGVLLYELLTKKPPWRGTSEIETLQRIVRDPPPDLQEQRPRMDRNLVPLVRRCLEKDPAHRYQVAGDIAAELENWLYTHGYNQDNVTALSRFVRRNAMRQMRWFERAVRGQPQPTQEDFRPTTPHTPRYDTPSKDDRRSAATAVDLKPRGLAEPAAEAAKEAPSTPPPVAIASEAAPAPKPADTADAVERRDTMIDMEAPPEVRSRPSRSRHNLPKSPALLADLENEEENAPTIAIRRDDIRWLPSEDTTEDSRRSTNPAAGRGTVPHPPAPAGSTPPPKSVPRPAPRLSPPALPARAREGREGVAPLHRSAHPPPPPKKAIASTAVMEPATAPPAAPSAPPPPPTLPVAAPSAAPPSVAPPTAPVSAPPPPPTPAILHVAPPSATPPPIVSAPAPAPVAPPSAAPPAAAPPPVAPPPAPRVLDMEAISAEVERLRTRATRRQEEAASANELARRINEEASLASEAARVAEEASALAKKAQEAAEAGAADEAMKLLERARDLAGGRRGATAARAPEPPSTS